MADTRRILDHPVLHWVQIAATASAAAWAVWEVVEARFANAAALAAVAALGLVLLSTPQRLAALFRLALMAAAYVNAAGFVLNLWVQRSPFDEIVHALTGFAGTATLAWLLLVRTSLIETGGWTRFVAIAVAIGVSLGIAWEVFEWLVGIIGDRTDTIVDLVMDAIGAVAAGLFCAWAARLRLQGRA